MKKGGPSLAVEVDGNPLPEDAARDVWHRFSEFCEDGGSPETFAKEEGVLSVKVSVKNGKPTLIVTSSP